MPASMFSLSSLRGPGHPRHSRYSQAGFTMVEIAISLAILGFALVAIIGVLPQGLQVQRENRSDTLVNMEGTYFLEAIRSGSEGIDELTNYVDWIQISNSPSATSYKYSNFLNGRVIVGLLTKPKYEEVSPGRWVTNYVTAKVRSVTGSAVEKGPHYRDFAFNYFLRPELVPYGAFTPDYLGTNYAAGGLTPAQQMEVSNRWAHARSMLTNMHELRLSIRWPVLPGDRPGEGQQVFRSLLSGRIFTTNGGSYGLLYYHQPSVHGM